MSIHIERDGDAIYSITIDGKRYDSDEDDCVTIPIKDLISQDISDFPQGIKIELCDDVNDNAVILHNIPTHCTLIDENRFKVYFDETETRKYWDAPVGLKLWMETKRDIIIDRSKNLDDIKLEHYDDDGAYISLMYSCELTVDTFKELLQSIDQIYAEIDGATDIALGSPFEKIENCNKESDFTLKILIPLFRSLGFSNVKYNHGNREYGKDITFARRSEFDEYEYYGVQVKFGDISGGASGEINELVSQALDAFKMPFYDVYSRNKVRISKLIIAISGRYTLNAIEKIVEGITDFPLKNNVIFIDGEKIQTLLERYRRF